MCQSEAESGGYYAHVVNGHSNVFINPFLLAFDTGRDIVHNASGSLNKTMAIGVASDGQPGWPVGGDGANLALGIDAGNGVTGSWNTLVGYEAGTALGAAGYNTLIGALAGNVTTGDQNTMLGEEAGLANTSGEKNVFIGRTAGVSNTSGSHNSHLGWQAGNNTTGSRQVLLGAVAHAGNIDDVVVLGYNASATATQNTVLGPTDYSAVIGASAAHASVKLQADSTTQGFLPPRMTTTQRNAISSPAAGLVIFNATTAKLACYDGSTWQAAW